MWGSADPLNREHHHVALRRRLRVRDWSIQRGRRPPRPGTEAGGCNGASRSALEGLDRASLYGESVLVWLWGNGTTSTSLERIIRRTGHDPGRSIPGGGQGQNLPGARRDDIIEELEEELPVAMEDEKKAATLEANRRPKAGRGPDELRTLMAVALHATAAGGRQAIGQPPAGRAAAKLVPTSTRRRTGGHRTLSPWGALGTQGSSKYLQICVNAAHVQCSGATIIMVMFICTVAASLYGILALTLFMSSWT